MKVAIIIPCFNKLGFTKRCVASVNEFTKDVDHQIIIVNNGSTDGTKEHFSGFSTWGSVIEPIHLPENRGFGEACNIGITRALSQDYTHVCLLNNDVEVTTDWLKLMLDCIEKQPFKRGAVQPTVCDFGGNVRDCGVGLVDTQKYGTENVEEIIRMLDVGQQLEMLRGVENDRLYLNGACLLMKRKMLEEIGLFNSDFFPAYFEEVDLCIRAHIAGWGMVHCGSAVVKHHFNTTSKSMPEMQKYFWDHWNLIKTRYGEYFKLLAWVDYEKS